MHQDLTTARRIQAGLLPRSIPQLDGFEVGRGFAPARELAGDFFDFLPYQDDQLAIAVGDVAGKATPAALYGSLAVGIMRGHVVQHQCPPAEMLAHMNEHLGMLQIEDRFLAMVYGVLDVTRSRFTFSNAAFPWPRRVRDGRVEQLRTSGFPLGPLPNSSYEDVVVDLRPSDVVVICSDGLEDGLDGELEPSNGCRLDAWLERLAHCDAQTIADELLEASKPTFVGTLHATDDRTVVVLRAH
jgi:sigma-B regulation protein RsbU (phosphoserine phosphatase)